MLNVNQITSTLAKLPDQALQQYATMHKNDPYIVSLAVAESNRRRELRTSGQGQMGGMPQTKVVDQDIAQMAPAPLPEQSGIGALPAPNMQRMADGGIAGYDEGGAAGQLAFNNEPVMRMADGGVARFAGEDESFVRSPFAFLNPGDAWEGVKRVFSEGIDAKAAEQRRKDALRKMKAPSEDTVGTSEFDTKQRPIREAAKQDETAQKAVEKAMKADAKAEIRTGASDAGIAGLMKQLEPMSLEQRAAAAKKLAAEANDESAAAYKPWMEQLKADREALAARKDSNLGEALMKAGFGMMAGKSQHAFQNIGEGAMQGLAAYQEANKADDAAKRALMQSEMALMQAQRAERSGNHKDAVSLMNQHRMEQQAAVQLGLQAQQIKQTGAYQQGMLAVHQARGGEEAKVRAEFGKLQAKVMDSLKNDVNYATATPAMQQKLQTEAMRRAAMNNPFLATYAQNIGFVGGPAGGKTRTLEGVDYDE